MNSVIRIVRKTTLPTGKTLSDTIGYLPSRGKANHEANDEIIASYLRSSSFWNWPHKHQFNEQMKDFNATYKVKIGWGLDLSINAVEHLREWERR